MSELFVQTSYQNGRTMVSDSFFTSPLKIAKPFYREGGYTEVMVLSAGPGMLKGDRYDMRYEMRDNTDTMLSAQSYQKLYNCAGGETLQSVRMDVGKYACLCYLPHPSVPFTGNNFTSDMEVRLAGSSKFFFSDILACGRQGMGERHSFGRFSSKVCVRVDERPVFLDHTRLFTDEADFDKLGFYEGRACQGLLYLYGYDDVALPTPQGDIEVAISKARAGFAVRMLSNSADAAYQYAKTLWEATRAR